MIEYESEEKTVSLFAEFLGCFFLLKRAPPRPNQKNEQGNIRPPNTPPSRKKKKLAFPSDLDEAEKFDPPIHPSNAYKCVRRCYWWTAGVGEQ